MIIKGIKALHIKWYHISIERFFTTFWRPIIYISNLKLLSGFFFASARKNNGGKAKKYNNIND